MQEKSRFMVLWVPYRNGSLFRDSSPVFAPEATTRQASSPTSITNGFAGVWFRHEKPLRFRAGPAGATQAFMDCGDMSPLSKRRRVGALQRRTRASS